MSNSSTPLPWHHKFDSKKILSSPNPINSIELLYYLYNNSTPSGIRDYIINMLYDCTPDAIDTILFQICHLICIWSPIQSDQLVNLLLYHCTTSIDITLKSTWILTAMQYHTAIRYNLLERSERINTIIEKIEMALINSSNTINRTRGTSTSSNGSNHVYTTNNTMTANDQNQSNTSVSTPIKRASSSHTLSTRQRSHSRTIHHMKRNGNSIASASNSPLDSPASSRIHSPSIPLHPNRNRTKSHQSPNNIRINHSSYTNMKLTDQQFVDRQVSEPTQISPHKLNSREQHEQTSPHSAVTPTATDNTATDNNNSDNCTSLISPLNNVHVSDTRNTTNTLTDDNTALLDNHELIQVLSKHIRKDYLHLILAMVTNLIKVSLILSRYLIDDRRIHLRKYIRTLDEKCVRGLYFPSSLSTSHYKLVRLLPDDCHALSSRDKAPFLMFCEIQHTNMNVYDTNTFTAYKSYQDAMQQMISTGIVDNELETMNIETVQHDESITEPKINNYTSSTSNISSSVIPRQVSTAQVQQAVIAAVNKQNVRQISTNKSSLHTMMHSDSVPIKLNELTIRASSDGRVTNELSSSSNHSSLHVRNHSVGDDCGVAEMNGVHAHHTIDTTDLLQQGIDLASTRHTHTIDSCNDNGTDNMNDNHSNKLVHSNTEPKLNNVQHTNRINGFGSDSLPHSTDTTHGTTISNSTDNSSTTPTTTTAPSHWLPSSYSLHAVFGESWSSRKQRIAGTSPYSTLPGWDICSVIFKAGDDCRQEVLAMQLITCCHNILQHAKLPIYLRPYSVLITSAQSGIIETIPDAISIDSLKKNFMKYNTTNGIAHSWIGLSEFFITHYLNSTDGSIELYESSIRNYVESMAGYSLIQYLLNVKDRHNGNILLSRTGHIIHIDYGFMLCGSPGNNFNFESAPFKLSGELLDVMGGNTTELFNYFKILFIRGFLELREHAHLLITLVDSVTQQSNMTCFGTYTVPNNDNTTTQSNQSYHPATQQFIDRFVLSYTAEQAVEYAVQLIDQSMLNWRTVQYDNFQRITNNIQ